MTDMISEEIIKDLIKERDDLEKQVKALKEWIKYTMDIDVEIEALIKQVKELNRVNRK